MWNHRRSAMSQEIPLTKEARTLVEKLDLQPHPEGGFYKEVFRSPIQVESLPEHAQRVAATSIYYLLPAGDFSAFHRLQSDEVWSHVLGDPLRLHLIHPSAGCFHIELGKALADGQHGQFTVLAGTWQAAEVIGQNFVLCTCTVAPGFDFSEFELATKDRLLASHPECKDVVERLCRE